MSKSDVQENSEMSATQRSFRLLKNMIGTLVSAIEQHIPPERNCTEYDDKKAVKASTLVDTAKHVVKDLDLNAPCFSELEGDLANLFEGGTFSVNISEDRGRFYVEMVDDWTGYIKKIFVHGTFAGAIKEASDRKDSCDLMGRMVKEAGDEVLEAEVSPDLPEEQPPLMDGQEPASQPGEVPEGTEKSGPWGNGKRNELPGQKVFST